MLVRDSRAELEPGISQDLGCGNPVSWDVGTSQDLGCGNPSSWDVGIPAPGMWEPQLLGCGCRASLVLHRDIWDLTKPQLWPQIGAEFPIPREPRDSLQQDEDSRGYEGIVPKLPASIVTRSATLPCRALASRGGQRTAGEGRRGPVGNILLNYYLFLFLINAGAGSCRCLVGSGHGSRPKKLLEKSWLFYPE